MSIKKIPMEMSSIWSANSTKCFLNLKFKFFFKYLDEFLAFWMDNLLIYSQRKNTQKHLDLVCEKFREAGIKFKGSKCKFFKNEIKYLGHLVSGKGISPMKQKIKAITY